MSETSKTDWKIFYVKKLGARLPEAFNLLSANKTATIRTLGLRHYCYWWGKNYYYLDYEIIPNNEKTAFGPTEYKKVIKKGKVVWETKGISWWQKFFTKSNLRSIPVSEDDFDYYDRTWNLDPLYAKNRISGVGSKGIGADGLTEMMKAGPSRRQILRKENETLTWWKRHPDPARKKQLVAEGYKIAKEKGLWKPAEENIDEKEANLQKQLEDGEITIEEYELELETIMGNRRKLAEVIAKNHPDPEGAPEEPPAKFHKKGKDKKIPNEWNEE